jgi:hypothetical protein
MDFKITKEMLENAADYLPLADKTVLAKQQAEECVVKARETTGVRTDSGSVLPLPPRYVCDEMGRSILEMSVFTGLYLLCEKPEEDGQITMNAETYDHYAGAHLFGQLTAMKSGAFGRDNPKLKTKIINMLADFNDYQKRLTAEIRNLLTMYNDPVDRFIAMNAAMATPEAMQGLLEELKDAAQAAEDYKGGEGA